MVLTDRQRRELHAGIYEYLKSRPGPDFEAAAQALLKADPEAGASATQNGSSTTKTVKTPVLEKKWTAIPRLQKKVLELERIALQNKTLYAHRSENGSNALERRLLPRLPTTHIMQGHTAVVTTVAVHPTYTVAASGSEDGTIKIWDHESGEYMRTLKGHTNTVCDICFAPAGNVLASASSDLSLKLWDCSSYSCLKTLRGHDHTISAIRFLPMLQSVAQSTQENGVSNNGAANTTSTTTGLEAAVIQCQYLLSASRDTTLKMWNVETGFCEQTLNPTNADWLRCLAVRADGSLFAVSGNEPTITVYDGSDRAQVCELRGHEHVVESIAFVTEETLGNKKKKPSTTADSRHSATVRDYLASCSRDRTVRLWNVTEAAVLSVFKAHENWVKSVLIHPSGNYILSCGDDKTIRVFDIKANRNLRTLEKAHDHFVTSISMHPTLPILVSGGVDQTVRCWQLD